LSGRALAVALALLLAGLARPLPGHAAVLSLGPSLTSHTASMTARAPTLDVYALLGDPASGLASAQMPQSGQITSAQVEGVVALTAGPVRDPVDAMVRIVDLVPHADGRVTLAGASQLFSLPVTAAPTAADLGEVTPVAPTNLCVHAGDLVGLATAGGGAEPNYPGGVPFEVLAPEPGARTGFFAGGALASPGTPLMLQLLPDEVPLLHVMLATGTDASAFCRGATGVRHPLPAASLSSQQAKLRTDGTVRVRLFCHRDAGCSERVTLRLHGRTIGSGAGSLPSHRFGSVAVKLSADAVSRLRAARSERVSATATSASGAAGDSVSATVTLLAG
jgi:hypothetical protein